MERVEQKFVIVALTKYGLAQVVECAKVGNEAGVFASTEVMLTRAVEPILAEGWTVTSFQIKEAIMVVLCTRPKYLPGKAELC